MSLAPIVALAVISITCQDAPRAAAPAGPKPVVVLLETIPIEPSEGRFDHLALDRGRHRLFATRVKDNAVTALDLDTERPTSAAEIHDRQSISAYEPHGVLYLAESDVVLVTNAGWETLDVVDAGSLKNKARVKIGPDVDNLRYEPTKKLVYVGFGEGKDGALAVVDTNGWKLAATIPIGGHPESFQLDATRTRAFVNVPELRAIVVVDLEGRKIAATWPVKEAESNYPMAIDGGGKRLFVGCRRPPKLLVFDSKDGRTIDSLPLGGDADDVFLDEASGRVFVSCGEGTIDVFERGEGDRYEPAGRVPTAPGARTCHFSPEEQRLYLAVPRRGEEAAEIRIYDTRR